MTNTSPVIQTQLNKSLARDECKQHDLDAIKHEIERYQENYEQSFLEIGRLLLLAKENFGKYGDWLKWLDENVDISTAKAQRLMRVAKHFANKTPVPFLNFSKMYILTAIPEYEFESFINSKYLVNGKFKCVKDMSKRELETIVQNYLKSSKKSCGKAKKK